MCGTSVAQFERTYCQLNDDIRLTTALADYRHNEGGTSAISGQQKAGYILQSLSIYSGTPQLNGKIERSQRSDGQEFY